MCIKAIDQQQVTALCLDLSSGSDLLIKLSLPSAHNLCAIFDSNMSISDHISAFSKTAISQIRNIRQICGCLDLNNALSITT